MMKQLGKILLVLISVIILDTPFISGQDRYPKPLPEANLKNVLKSTAIPEHDLIQDPFIEEILDQVNLDTLISFVRVLTGEDSVWINDTPALIQHRVDFLGNDLAADFVKGQLGMYGLEVSEESFSFQGRNIYGIQKGILYPEKQYIICAHYDAVADYCADDNASGVAAVLEAARILSGYALEYTLVYAFWDQEEFGIVGSSYYASQAMANNTDIAGVVNMDMIGWDSNDDGLADIHSSNVADSDDLANLMLINNDLYGLKLNPVIYNPGTGASDHSRFWENGYGAILLSQAYYGDDLNPYYHCEKDRIDKFNLPYFHNMSKLAMATITTLVQFVNDTLIKVTDSARGYQEHPAEIEVKGAFTSFLENPESITVCLTEGSDTIHADSILIQSNNSLIAYFSIPENAFVGLWDVELQSERDGSLVDDNSFEVLPSPAIISVLHDTLRISAGTGSVTMQTVTIQNAGGSELSFRILNPGRSNALLFDGIDDFLEIGDGINLVNSSITLEAWAKRFSVDDYRMIWGQGSDGTNEGLLGGFLNNNEFVCAFYHNDLESSIKYTDFDWHHWACTFDASTKERRIYQDGLIVADDIASANYQGSGNFYIGCASWFLDFFDGIIDEVRVWGIARSQSEIQAHLNRELTGNEPGLVGYWPFNEATGDTVYDLSSNGNHGVLENGVQWVPEEVPLAKWLSIESDSGSCKAQNSVNIELLIDAGELKPGAYSGQIILSSNDPFNPIVGIPFLLTVSHTAGTLESLGQIGVSVYPNPAIDILNIDSYLHTTLSIEIISYNGQLVLNREMQGPTQQLDLSSLQKGVYFITIRTTDSVTTRKIIKL